MPATPMPPDRVAVCTAHMDKIADQLQNLAARWLDEREYEDFQEYAAVMKRDMLQEGATFVNAQKRPFGFRAKLATGEVVLYGATMRNVFWQRKG